MNLASNFLPFAARGEHRRASVASAQTGWAQTALELDADALNGLERQVAALVRAVVQAAGPATGDPKAPHLAWRAGQLQEPLQPMEAGALVSQLAVELTAQLQMMAHAKPAHLDSPGADSKSVPTAQDRLAQKARLQRAAATVATCQLALARQLDQCGRALAVLLPQTAARSSSTYAALDPNRPSVFGLAL